MQDPFGERPTYDFNTSMSGDPRGRYSGNREDRRRLLEEKLTEWAEVILVKTEHVTNGNTSQDGFEAGEIDASSPFESMDVR